MITSAATTEVSVSRAGRKAQLAGLTSLRFGAALYVLIFHYSGTFFHLPPSSNAFSLGYTGVTFFFILSGFVLGYSYFAADFSDGRTLRRYFIARFARIYPVYALALLASFPFFIADILRLRSPLQQILASAAFVVSPVALQSWIPGAACAWNCPGWSISTEFFFYLMFPMLIIATTGQPVRWLAVTLAFWMATVGLQTALWAHFNGGLSLLAHADRDVQVFVADLIQYFPVSRLPEFALGVLLFLFWREHDRLRTTVLLPALSFFGAGAVLLSFSSEIPEVFLHNGLTALVWVPLILATANMRGGPLLRPLAVFLGQTSFALYLFHMPIAHAIQALDKRLLNGGLGALPWAAAAAALTATLIFSAFVFRYVEDPARRRIVTSWIARTDTTGRTAPDAPKQPDPSEHQGTRDAGEGNVSC